MKQSARRKLNMSNRARSLLRIQGMLLVVLSVSMTIPAIIALCQDEQRSASAFGATIVPCFVLGLLLAILIKPSSTPIKSRDGFLIVSMCWLSSSLVGALPMFLSGAIPSYLDAFFESCSGFSTTGASILTDIEPLPRSVLFWRSFTHWLGGMGILVFVTALAPTLGISGQLVANAETPGPTKDKITAKFSDTAKNLYLLYILLTVVETLLLLLGGLSLYDSLLHTFGTVGTGGFSCYNDSIAHFDSAYVEWVIVIFMLLSGVNFNLFYLSTKHGPRTIFRDEEVRFYLSVIGLASGVILAYQLGFSGFADFGEKLRDTVFQVVSLLTTTGYITADYDLWPTFAKMVLFMLFFIGGCSSSTGGGVKCVRIQVAAKLVRRGISLKLHPNRIAKVTFNDKELNNDVVINITNFIFTYFLIMAAGFVLISFNGLGFIDSFSASATCLGNIGPGFAAVGPTMNFAALSGFSKLVCSMLMICGRLELFTVIVLFSKYYWNPNRA